MVFVVVVVIVVIVVVVVVVVVVRERKVELLVHKIDVLIGNLSKAEPIIDVMKIQGVSNVVGKKTVRKKMRLH